MKRSNKKKKLPNSYKKTFPFFLLIATLFMGIGYASINSITADITGIALANSQDGIFITDVIYNSDQNADTINSKVNSFYESTLNSKIVLSSEDNNSYITYKVTLYNSTNDTYAFENVKYIEGEQTYDNTDISFELIWLDDNRLLTSKSSISFFIKFNYASDTIENNILNSYLNFSFKKIHLINYINIDSAELPQYVFDGNDLTIDFSNENYSSLIINIDGINTTNFTYENGILTVPNVTGNISIKIIKSTFKIFNKDFEIVAADTPLNSMENGSGLYVSSNTNNGGSTYYFRGNVEENYVDFAGFVWRVLRVNEDGTIRLIMQDGINENMGYQFYSTPHDLNYMYYSYNDNNAKSVLEDWYNTNIVETNYSDRVVTGEYFCEQAKIIGGSNYTSGNAIMEEISTYNPTFKCTTDGNGYGLVNASIGLVSYDEVIYAGGYDSKISTEYYLYNENSYWTMSPAGLNTNNYARVWYSSSGTISRDGNVNAKLSLRPVVNVKADVVVTGTGLADDHWIIQ